MRNILQGICFQQKRFSTAPKKKLNKRRTKRGKRKSVKRKYQNINEKEKKMYILGANAAGLFNKLESFYRNISLFKPGVFFIQESKARQKNKIKLNDYVIFEQIRNLSGGGGLLTAVHKSMKPVSVGNDDCEEILVVEGNVSDF